MLQWWACRAVNCQHYRFGLFSLHLRVVITLTGRRGNTWWNGRWRSVSCCRQWWASFNKHQHPEISQGESSEYQRGLCSSEASESTRAPHAALRSFSYGIIWKAYAVLSLPFCSETKGELRVRLECELASPLGATLAPKHPLSPETWALNQ